MPPLDVSIKAAGSWKCAILRGIGWNSEFYSALLPLVMLGEEPSFRLSWLPPPGMGCAASAPG